MTAATEPRATRVRRAWGLCGLLALSTCQRVDVPPDPQELRLPTGAVLAPSGQWLLVVNSNLDEAYSGSTLVSVDLGRLWAALDDEPLAEGGTPTDERPCRRGTVGEDERAVVECDARRFIAAEHTVELPSGGGNIGVDYPTGEEGPMRLLIPSSIDRAVTWIDVLFAEDSDIQRVSCGQEGLRCAEDHVLTRLNKTVACRDGTLSVLPGDPGRISVGTSAHRYAYLPHLLGASMTLISLSGAKGPELAFVSCDFFEDNTDQLYKGGFSAVERRCDPAERLTASPECARPTLLTTFRFQPGLRLFTVRTGGDEIAPQRTYELDDVNSIAIEDRPLTGDLQFEDPAAGDRLLIVRTTPPALTVADVRPDGAGSLEVAPIAKADLCRNPNILTVYRPPTGEKIAFVSCYSDDQVAAVMLGSLATITIDVDDGPNDMVVDYLRDKLYVINTQSSTITIVELERNPRFLQVVGRVGLAG